MLELGVFFAMTRLMLCIYEVVSFRKVDVWSEGASDAGPHSGIRLNYAHIHDWLQIDWSHTISLNVGNAYECSRSFPQVSLHSSLDKTSAFVEGRSVPRDPRSLQQCANTISSVIRELDEFRKNEKDQSLDMLLLI